MPKFKFTKTFESYYYLEIDADNFEQALTIANGMNEDNAWEEDLEFTPCIRRTWAKIDADGETEEDGELTEEQLP
jgi:hypothetical protein